jgi:phage head maturation protease
MLASSQNASHRVKIDGNAADWDRMRWLPLVAVVATLALAEVAVAATPAAYRTNVNGICRGYSPALKKLATQVNRADAAKDYRAWGVAVGKWLTLDLAEDHRVEVIAVPASLDAEMSRILLRMKKLDAHSRAALADQKAGKLQALVSELLTIGELRTPLSRALDGVGLRDCGSNQSD